MNQLNAEMTDRQVVLFLQDLLCGDGDPMDFDYQDALKKAIHIIEKKEQPCEDAISREAALDAIGKAHGDIAEAEDNVRALPSVQPISRWIPVSERLPDNTDPVNITWVNHDPASYYADIKDKPFTATGALLQWQMVVVLRDLSRLSR